MQTTRQFGNHVSSVKSNPEDSSYLEDATLSWRAKGLLAYMLTRPAGFEFSMQRLQKNSVEGADAFRSAINLLKARGYLLMTRVSDGRRISWKWDVSDTRVSEWALEDLAS